MGRSLSKNAWIMVLVWALYAVSGCAAPEEPSCPDGWSSVASSRCAPQPPRDIGAISEAADGGDRTEPDGWSSPSGTDGGSGQAALDDALPSFVCDRALQSVRISELLVDPEGADNGAEFIELAGPPGTRLDGGLLVLGNGATNTPYRELPLVGRIPDSGQWVIGGDQVQARDAALPGTIQNGPDGVGLYGCDGEWLDGLSYGGEVATLWGVGLPAAVTSGASLVSCPGVGGEDRERWVAHPPSPGEASVPASCTPCVPLPAGSLLIHEVRYDPPGADGGGELEFVEVYATRSVAAGAASLLLLEGRTGEPYADPIPLPAMHGGRFVVVGGAAVWPTDVPLPRAMQNGPDALSIWDCDGGVVDALAYGEGEVLGGEGAAAVPVRDGTLGRPHGAEDSDDNATDFRALARATPGAPNVE